MLDDDAPEADALELDEFEPDDDVELELDSLLVELESLFVELDSFESFESFDALMMLCGIVRVAAPPS